jgi:hypothetical protein
MMKVRIQYALLVVASLAAASAASGQQLQFIAVNGTVNPPVVLQSSLPPAQRPAVQRLGVGFYRFTFTTNVSFFNGHAQRGGAGGDASSMLLTSAFHTNNARIVDVRTHSIVTGSPTNTTPADSRMSIIFTR